MKYCRLGTTRIIFKVQNKNHPKETIDSKILLRKPSLKKTNAFENIVKIFEMLSNIK
jgi:hypothetical protein